MFLSNWFAKKTRKIGKTLADGLSENVRAEWRYGRLVGKLLLTVWLKIKSCHPVSGHESEVATSGSLFAFFQNAYV